MSVSGESDDEKSSLYKTFDVSPSSTNAVVVAQRRSTPGVNFFYNDEVISHLHGYMYLIGLFLAKDVVFLGIFCILAGVAGYGAMSSIVPANPKVPGSVAATTLVLTLLVRYGFHFYDDAVDTLPVLSAFNTNDVIRYTGPTDSAVLYEVAIVLLNVGWGFWGTWQTKEPSAKDGATYGF